MIRNQQTVLPDEVREKVVLRAYEIYQERGGQHGHDIDDWLQAENEVLAAVERNKALYDRKSPSTTQSTEASQMARRTKANAAATR